MSCHLMVILCSPEFWFSTEAAVQVTGGPIILGYNISLHVMWFISGSIYIMIKLLKAGVYHCLVSRNDPTDKTLSSGGQRQALIQILTILFQAVDNE